jgi:hypothetical protein
MQSTTPSEPSRPRLATATTLVPDSEGSRAKSPSRPRGTFRTFYCDHWKPSNRTILTTDIWGRLDPATGKRKGEAAITVAPSTLADTLPKIEGLCLTQSSRRQTGQWRTSVGAVTCAPWS